MISIVIPVFNEEDSVKNNIQEILKYIPNDYEIIFVDDGSKDNTWSIIQELNKENPKITGLRFSRNFGKEAALMAGLSKASGDAVITMDSDLQHPPEYIPTLIDKMRRRIPNRRGKENKKAKRNSYVQDKCRSFL